MSTVPQPPVKPLDLPPAYSELPDPTQQHILPNQPVATDSRSSGSNPFSFPTHPSHYGPTPIAEQAQLLPYYDPRSPYAIAEATSRARWRFIEAALWAVLILTMVSIATGWEVESAKRYGGVEPGVYSR